MKPLTETNTSANLNNPLLLLPFAFSSLLASSALSEDQMNIPANNYSNLEHYKAQFIESSGSDFQFDHYFQNVNNISEVEVFSNFINKLDRNTVSLDPDMLNVINEKFWDLF